MLFTAIAATVVMLPLAIYGLPGDDEPTVAADAPQLAQQPLTGLGGGETIREIHQDTPFSMVALTAEDLTGTSARVRAKKPDGTWGPWYEAEALEGVGPESSAQARAAPNRSSSAAPPPCRSPSPVPPAPRHRATADSRGSRRGWVTCPPTSSSRSPRTSTPC